MCLTGIFRTVSASAISERWHRHGTASAHINAQDFVFASLMARASAASKVGSLHVIRKSTESRIAPAQVGGVFGGMSQAAEFLDVRVSDS